MLRLDKNLTIHCEGLCLFEMILPILIYADNITEGTVDATEDKGSAILRLFYQEMNLFCSNSRI